MLREPEKSQFPLFPVAGAGQCLATAGRGEHFSILPLGGAKQEMEPRHLFSASSRPRLVASRV